MTCRLHDSRHLNFNLRIRLFITYLFTLQNITYCLISPCICALAPQLHSFHQDHHFRCPHPYPASEGALLVPMSTVVLRQCPLPSDKLVLHYPDDNATIYSKIRACAGSTTIKHHLEQQTWTVVHVIKVVRAFVKKNTSPYLAYCLP